MKNCCEELAQLFHNRTFAILRICGTKHMRPAQDPARGAKNLRGGTDVPPRIIQPMNFKTSSNIFAGVADSLKRMGL